MRKNSASSPQYKGKRRTKTNDQDFQLFKKEVQLWVDFFGLKEWSLLFTHGETRTIKGVRAEVELHWDAHYATFYLAKDWKEDEVTTELVRRSAFHEVIHLLLYKLMDMAIQRFLPSGLIELEEEAIVRILENSVFDKMYLGER